MCTFLFAWRVVPGAPIIIAANRDESRSRLADPPLALHRAPLIVGGRDRLAGGTWLAVDPAGGRVAAVTNRHPRTSPIARDPTRHSRGELPITALLARDEDIAAVLGGLNAEDYNPVNVIYLSRTAAYWLHLDQERGAGLEPIAPGIHALTLFDLDDPTSPKDQRLLQAVSHADADNAPALLAEFEMALRDHGPDGAAAADAACIHLTPYGTVSSSTVVVTDDASVTYRHAGGFPCVTPFLPVAFDDGRGL